MLFFIFDLFCRFRFWRSFFALYSKASFVLLSQQDRSIFSSKGSFFCSPPLKYLTSAGTRSTPTLSATATRVFPSNLCTALKEIYSNKNRAVVFPSLCLYFFQKALVLFIVFVSHLAHRAFKPFQKSRWKINSFVLCAIGPEMLVPGKTFLFDAAILPSSHEPPGLSTRRTLSLCATGFCFGCSALAWPLAALRLASVPVF